MSVFSSALAMLLACSGFLAYELLTFRRALVAEVTTEAQVLAFSLAAPLSFDDPKAAAASLEALSATPYNHAALLADARGRPFATYGSPGFGPPAPKAGSWHRFERNRLLLSVPILSEGHPIGSLTIESSLAERDRRVLQILALAAALLLVSLVAGVAVSSRLQRRILLPVLNLTAAAEHVSRNADYSLRVAAPAEDELGRLAATFNAMLARIEQQDAVLRSSEEHYRLIFEQSPLPKWVYDLETLRFLAVNEAAIRNYGYSREEFLRMSLKDIRPPDEIPRLLSAVGDAHVERFIHRKKDGSLITVEIHSHDFSFEGRRARLVVANDVTERERLERVQRDAIELASQNKRIQEANRLKSEFLANMSHELRTPLNAILGFGDLLHSGMVPVDSPQHQEFLGDILKSGRHLLQLINDVLDLAKVEAGKLDFRPEPIDLEKVIGEVAGIVRSLAISRRIELTVTTEPSLQGGIVLDPARFKQIVYNFVSNALKFTPQGGKVAVRAAPEGDSRFRLEVEDTGPGISPEDIEKLFVEFQQLDSGTTKQHGGTGLGLALTRKLAEAQGGSVGVRSTPGSGSVFYAILPRRAETGATPKRRLPTTAEARSILIVEDEASDHALLVQSLIQAGYAVEAATTGAKALALCAERRFDAITLDLLLPDMSGQDVLARIRTAGPNRDVPVVVVTVVAERGAVAGLTVNDFLPKPIDPEVVLASLRRAGIYPEQPGSVLVIDDDAHALKLMSAALTQLGYRATCVTSAEDALRSADRAPPRAVVLDLLMPNVDGFEFLERFRTAPANRDTPVLIWTVKDLTQAERERLRRSAQAIIHKGDRGIPSLLDDLRRFLGPPRPAGEERR